MSLEKTVFDLVSDNRSMPICGLALRRFLRCMSEGYSKTVAYHNESHAEQVILACEEIFGHTKWTFVCQNDFLHIALIIAAACHDVGHPGIREMVKVRSCSLMEETHVDIMLAALNEYNFISGCDATKNLSFRRIVSELILNTNMSRHGRLIEQASELSTAVTKSRSIEDDIFVLSLILKAADLWHSTYSWKLHTEWSDKLNVEIAGQRMQAGEDIENQIWFMTATALPLFKAVRRVADIDNAVQQCIDNVQMWHKMNA